MLCEWLENAGIVSKEEVLILVLMEDALRVYIEKHGGSSLEVLILVLMEDALRASSYCTIGRLTMSS